MQYTKIILFSLICYFSNGQKQQIQCFLFDKTNRNPIENAYIMSGDKPKGVSNTDGSFSIEKGDNIRISHISYDKLEAETSNLVDGEKLFLTPKTYLLSSIKIYPNKDVENIIKECLLRKKENYKESFEQMIRMNHVGKNLSDTLTLFDGYLKLKREPIMSKYYADKNGIIVRKYFDVIQKTESCFDIGAKAILSGLNISSFPFIQDTKQYDYDLLEETDEIYTISFSPKKMDKFKYSGAIQINKKDYAVLSVKTHLIENEKNDRITALNNFSTSDKYHFSQEKMEYIFEKRSDSFYYVKSAFRTVKMQQFKVGEIKSPKTLFVQSIIVNTPDAKLNQEYEIDMYRLKKQEKVKISSNPKYDKITKDGNENDN